MADQRINSLTNLDPADIVLPEFGCSFFVYKDVGTGLFPDNIYSAGDIQTLTNKLRETFKSFFTAYPVYELFKGLRFHLYLHNYVGSGTLPTDTSPTNQFKVNILNGVANGEREKYHPFAQLNRSTSNFFDHYGRVYSDSQDIGIAFYNDISDDAFFNYIFSRQILAKMVASIQLFNTSSSDLSKTLSRFINEIRITLVRGNSYFAHPLLKSDSKFDEAFNELTYYNQLAGDPQPSANDPTVPTPSYVPATEFHEQMRQQTERSWFGARRFCEDVIYFLGGLESVSSKLRDRANPRIPSAHADIAKVLNGTLTANYIRRYSMILLATPIIYTLLKDKVFYDLSGLTLAEDQLSIAPVINTVYYDWSELLDDLPNALNTFPISGKVDWVGWSIEDNNSYSTGSVGNKRYQILTFESVITNPTEIYHDKKSLTLFEFKDINGIKKWVPISSFLPQNMFVNTANSEFTGFQP